MDDHFKVLVIILLLWFEFIMMYNVMSLFYNNDGSGATYSGLKVLSFYKLFQFLNKIFIGCFEIIQKK